MILEGIFGIIVALYLIIGLFLALYMYMTSPGCSLGEAVMVFFLWPFMLLLAYCVFGLGKNNKNAEEDCGC